MNDKILRKAKVFYKNDVAGCLFETDSEYIFQYDKAFLKKDIAISSSLPVREESYKSKELFNFFKGLLPEGWYLEIVSRTLKIDKKDYFGLLIGTATIDTIGAVTVKQEED